MATISRSRTQGIRIGLERAVARVNLGQMLAVALLLLGLSVTMMPFLWMILGSFKTHTEVIRIPPTFWPENPTLDSYRTIFTDPNLPLGRFYMNSTVIAVANTVTNLFTSALLGYLFAKFQFRGKEVFFGWFLLSMMIPSVVTMIPDFMILSKLGLTNNLLGLIVLSGLNAFGIFMMRQFLQTLPNDLLDAARIDGASEWQIFLRVVLPQLGPPLATLGTLTFMANWNNYLWPMIVLQKTKVRTLPIIQVWYETQHGDRPDLTMAASVLIIIPILIVYAFFQRWIVRGFTTTGIRQ